MVPCARRAVVDNLVASRALHRVGLVRRFLANAAGHFGQVNDDSVILVISTRFRGRKDFNAELVQLRKHQRLAWDRNQRIQRRHGHGMVRQRTVHLLCMSSLTSTTNDLSAGAACIVNRLGRRRVAMLTGHCRHGSGDRTLRRFCRGCCSSSKARVGWNVVVVAR